MTKTTPNQNEIIVGLEDMFFSTTDTKGIILDGNDIFVKFSQFDREDLIGAPHNIVRHPDMPKAIFKLLWTSIKNEKPICAYVKI